MPKPLLKIEPAPAAVEMQERKEDREVSFQTPSQPQPQFSQFGGELSPDTFASKDGKKKPTIAAASSSVARKQSTVLHNADSDVKEKIADMGTLARRASVVRMWNKRPDKLKDKTHYRRGSIVLQQMELNMQKKGEDKVTAQEKRAYERLKNLKDKHILHKRSISALAVFSRGSGDALSNFDPFAVSNMPIDIQIGFRTKILTLLAIQLAGAMAMTMLLREVAPSFVGGFAGGIGALIGAFGIMIASLVLLFLVKYKHPLNYAFLILFTFSESLFMAAAMRLFDTYAPIITAAIICASMLLMNHFATRLRKPKKEKNAEGQSPRADASFRSSGRTVEQEYRRLHKTLAHFVPSGFKACLCASALALVIKVALDVSAVGFMASIGCAFVGVLWFSYDAACLCRKMSADEYIQAIVFFYTDMILFVIFLFVATLCVIACTATGGEGANSCDGCYCGGGGAGTCCYCEGDELTEEAREDQEFYTGAGEDAGDGRGGGGLADINSPENIAMGTSVAYGGTDFATDAAQIGDMSHSTNHRPLPTVAP